MTCGRVSGIKFQIGCVARFWRNFAARLLLCLPTSIPFSSLVSSLVWNITEEFPRSSKAVPSYPLAISVPYVQKRSPLTSITAHPRARPPQAILSVVPSTYSIPPMNLARVCINKTAAVIGSETDTAIPCNSLLHYTRDGFPSLNVTNFPFNIPQPR